jgi:ammonia channel protein AmtB
MLEGIKYALWLFLTLFVIYTASRLISMAVYRSKFEAMLIFFNILLNKTYKKKE